MPQPRHARESGIRLKGSLIVPRYTDASVARNREAQKARNAKNNPARKRSHGKLLSRIADLEEREFVGWDGEGYRTFSVDGEGVTKVDHRYMLFGNSKGWKVSGYDLSTVECLDLMLASEADDPEAIHVGFATEYDVNMWLKDLEWRHLAVLHDAGVVIWKGYRIKHTPGKWFSVSKGGLVATIYNVFGFFHSSYIRALYKYEIGTEEQRQRIKDGKNARKRFTYSQLAEVTRYWAEEISLLPALMEVLREAVYSAGFYITEWHGPGALASYALRDNKMGQFKGNDAETPASVKMARMLAYAGGRFQGFRSGLYSGPVYTADINSAYAYAISLLPRLDNGRWRNIPVRSVRDRGVARFGLYRISFDMSDTSIRKAREWGIPLPLFHRSPKGGLSWPHRVEGWYWSPEAATVVGHPAATFLEAIEYEDDGTYPFAWIADAFQRRLQLQDLRHPAEKAYKWMLAAMYGAMAQRVGWNKKTRTPPRWHQLEWAGFVTSMCRAMVFRAALGVGAKGGLVSIDTDGVTSTVPFDVKSLTGGVGKGLGEWKLEEYDGILHWQNGIYWLKNKEGEWIEPKTRGVPRGSMGVDKAFDAIRQSHNLRDPQRACLEISREHFVGYSQGLQNQWDSWRRWVPRNTSIVFGGRGKGMHIPALCAKCRVCGSIPLHTTTHFPPDDPISSPHHLPWLEEKEQLDNFTELIWEDELM